MGIAIFPKVTKCSSQKLNISKFIIIVSFRVGSANVLIWQNFFISKLCSYEKGKLQKCGYNESSLLLKEGSVCAKICHCVSSWMKRVFWASHWQANYQVAGKSEEMSGIPQGLSQLQSLFYFTKKEQIQLLSCQSHIPHPSIPPNTTTPLPVSLSLPFSDPIVFAWLLLSPCLRYHF